MIWIILFTLRGWVSPSYTIWWKYIDGLDCSIPYSVKINNNHPTIRGWLGSDDFRFLVTIQKIVCIDLFSHSLEICDYLLLLRMNYNIHCLKSKNFHVASGTEEILICPIFSYFHKYWMNDCLIYILLIRKIEFTH